MTNHDYYQEYIKSEKKYYELLDRIKLECHTNPDAKLELVFKLTKELEK